MKHNILLAAADKKSLIPLMQGIKELLHPGYEKYFKVFFHQEVLKGDMVVVGETDNGTMDDLVSQMESEILLEKFASENQMQVDLIKSEKPQTILSLSTVADILIIDINSYQEKDLTNEFLDFLSKVECPILFLPKDYSIDCLVAVHDGTKDSVKMMKSFLKLFGDPIRQKPLSLLMAEPETEKEMRSEKVFIGFLRQYFQNFGAQHMHDETLPSLFKYVQKECKNPMVIVKEEEAMEVIHSRDFFETKVFDHPLFFFKD